MQRTATPPSMRLLAALAAAILLPGAAAAQADRILAVDALFAESVRPESPGCAVAAMRAGEMLYTTGYGLASVEHGVPITPRTVFYVGSVSKQFVAMSVALLQQQGALAFDDDIRRYLPEIPAYDAPITIRHLIHHTSGLRDYLGLLGLAGRDYAEGPSRAEVLALIARQRALNFAPGEQYLYSNSGYLLLAEIVERASGLTLREYTERHIFGPLGMTHSHFHDDASHLVPHRADGYTRRADGTWAAMPSRFALVGSGGLYTTVVDLARWDATFYENTLGDGTEALLDTVHTRGVLNDGDTLGYAFALQLGETRWLRTVQHSGSLGGYRAHLVRFPDERFTVAVLCNTTTANATGLAHGVAEVYLGERMAPLPEAPAREARTPVTPPGVELSAEELAAYAGDYVSDELRVTYVLAVEGDTLTLRIGYGEPSALRFTGNDAARARPGLMLFARDGAGTITGFRLNAGRVQGVVFERR